MNSEKRGPGRPSKEEMATKLVFCRLCRKNLKLPVVDSFLDHFGVHAKRRRFSCTDCSHTFNNLIRWSSHTRNCSGTQIDGLDKSLIHEWMGLAGQCFPEKKDMLVEYLKKRGESLGLVTPHHSPNKQQAIRNNSSMNRVSSSNRSESTRTCKWNIDGQPCSQKVSLGSGKQQLKPLLDHVSRHTDTQRFRCSACVYQSPRLQAVRIHVQKFHRNNGYVFDYMGNQYLHETLLKAMKCFPSMRTDLEAYVVAMADRWIAKRHIPEMNNRGPSNEDAYGLQNSAPNSPLSPPRESTSGSHFQETIPPMGSLSDLLKSIASNSKGREQINCRPGENYQTPEPEPLSRESTNATNYQRSENMAPQATSSMSTTSNATHHQTPMALLSTMVIKTENPSDATPLKQTLIKTEQTTPPTHPPTHPPVSYVVHQELLKKHELLKEDNAKYINRIGELSATNYTLKLEIEKLQRKLEKFENVIELE